MRKLLLTILIVSVVFVGLVASAVFFQQKKSALTQAKKFDVEFQTARDLLKSGKTKGGTMLLKELADDRKNTARDRANAIEEIAHHYHKTRDPEITRVISFAEPYRSMFLRAADERDAYNLIFEYAASLYPLPVSEFRTAQMYAEEILSLNRSPNRDRERRETLTDQYLDKIRESIARAETELRSHPDRYERDIPSILLRKAELAGTLIRAGYDFIGDTEILYEEALSAAADNKDLAGFVVVHHSRFLAHTAPEERKEDIVTLASRFYASSEYEGSNILTFFKNAKDDPELNNRGTLRVADVDPKFKEFLRTRFGWPI